MMRKNGAAQESPTVSVSQGSHSSFYFIQVFGTSPSLVSPTPYSSKFMVWNLSEVSLITLEGNMLAHYHGLFQSNQNKIVFGVLQGKTATKLRQNTIISHLKTLSDYLMFFQLLALFILQIKSIFRER